MITSLLMVRGGYGLMVFKDRGMTENAMDLVRMDF